MNRVRMRTTVLFGPERKRLERNKEYDLADASALVPRYAEYIDGSPEEERSPAIDYSTFTVRDLRRIAEDEGIDLGSATLKADIIKAIEAAQGE